MKKLMMFAVAALLVSGAAFAGDKKSGGKDCCKGKTCGKKKDNKAEPAAKSASATPAGPATPAAPAATDAKTPAPKS